MTIGMLVGEDLEEEPTATTLTIGMLVVMMKEKELGVLARMSVQMIMVEVMVAGGQVGVGMDGMVVTILTTTREEQEETGTDRSHSM